MDAELEDYAMRKKRIKSQEDAYYHLISRIVDKDFKYDEEERQIFYFIMRKVARFCGVEVVTFAIMSNHFHILAFVPAKGRVVVTEQMLLERVGVLYGPEEAEDMEKRWKEWRNLGMGSFVTEEQEKLRKRMGDVSMFMKELKQRATICYNARHQREGTMWEGRFKSVLVEPDSDALEAVSAYIDLNPVRAGMVEDPADYKWSGYGTACAGNRDSRRGLELVYEGGVTGENPWRFVSRDYRQILYCKGIAKDGKKGFTEEEIQKTLDAGGKLPLPTLLRCKMRQFSAGKVLGSKAFVEEAFKAYAEAFCKKQRKEARPLPSDDGCAPLCVAQRNRRRGMGS